MRKFLAGAAALALIAGGAYADPGKGNGGGGGNKGGGHAAAAGPSMAGSHGQGQDKASARAKGNGGASQDRGGKSDTRGRSAKADRVVGNGANRGKAPVQANRADRVERVDRIERVERIERGNNRGKDRIEDVRVVREVIGFDRGQNRGLIDGCPPGLAKKNNGCLPPGLAKDRDGYRDAFYRPSWFGYSGLGDGRYFYDDGYLYRMNNAGSVLGYIPLLGGALSIGNPWPSMYQPVPVPDYYVQYYNLGAPNSYRYADDVLYRVNPQTDAITSIAALLTGDQFAVGQPMPAGYDVYNVPYGYQDRYYDRDDAYYRYADGYVYQVDPTTQLIQAAIQLLT